MEWNETKKIDETPTHQKISFVFRAAAGGQKNARRRGTFRGITYKKQPVGRVIIMGSLVTATEQLAVRQATHVRLTTLTQSQS